MRPVVAGRGHLCAMLPLMDRLLAGGGFRLGLGAALALHPVASILGAGRVFHRAEAVAFAAEELALIDVAIGVFGHALAMDLALAPGSGEAEAVREGDGAGAGRAIDVSDRIDRRNDREPKRSCCVAARSEPPSFL